MEENQGIYKSKTKHSGIRYSFEHIVNSAKDADQDMVHLRLVCQVGSLLELEHETGAAHFIEHLGFRGTRSFDHGELVKLVESIGSSFGPDLNARTSLCETIWNLDIPLSALKIGLKILNEWAFWIRISDDDVNVERKVILEEWRQKQTATQRTKCKFWELVAPLVSERLPIGTVEFISKVTCQTLRTFYETCYCSDSLMVVCVVERSSASKSYIDAREFKKEMEAAFSIENCPRLGSITQRRFPRSLGDLGNSAPGHIRYACVVDPDLIHSAVSMEILSDHAKVTPSREFFRRDLIKRIVSSLLDERFREKQLNSTHGQNCSVSFGVSLQQPYIELSSVRTELKYKAQEEDVHVAVFSLIHELISIAKIGFSISELNHAKMKWAKQIRQTKRTVGAACDELVEHFSLAERTPLFGFECEKRMLLTLLDEVIEQDCIRLDEVNSFCRVWLSDLLGSIQNCGADELCSKRVRPTNGRDTILVLYQGNSVPDGVGEKSLESAMYQALAEPVINELEKYDIKYNEDSLKDQIFQSLGQYNTNDMSRIKHEVYELSKTKATIHSFTFDSKSIRVCIKQTDSSEQRISLQAFAKGGATELHHTADDATFNLLGDVLRESGIVGLSGSQLLKLESFTGTRLYLQRHLHHRGIGGSCPTHEIDLLLAMILARTMRNKLRVDSKVLQRLKQREVDCIRMTLELNGPAHEEAKALREIAFGSEEPLLNPHTIQDVILVDSERLHKICQLAFGNLEEFTFCLVGKFPSTIVSSVRSFAANVLLNKVESEEELQKWRRDEAQIRLMNLQFYEGKLKVIHVGQTATDKSQVFIVARPLDCLLDEIPNYDFGLSALCEAIRSRLLSKLRQDNGEVYSVSTELSRASLSPHARVFVAFSCAMNRDIQLAEQVQRELGNIVTNGFSFEESSNTLAAMKTKAAKSTSDSHLLFQILDGFKFAAADDVSKIDEIASSSFVKQFEAEDGIDSFRQLLQNFMKRTLHHGTSCLIIRYCPQKL